jgi:hypothetical protein
MIAHYDWSFQDGTTGSGPKIERTYAHPGEYTEVLKVSDELGNVAYDFAIVQILDRQMPEPAPPTIHAAFAPTQGLLPGDPVTFKVRAFGTTDGSETWDFGDGSSLVETHSDGNVQKHAREGYASVVHRFNQPGDYLVRVERVNGRGQKATARLHVPVQQTK